MLYIYRLAINLIFLISPIIIIYRIFKKKEDPKRFFEKIGKFDKGSNNNLIWFHGSSVGEILSVIPLIKHYEKDKSIDQILITSSTLSSSKILKKFKFKKTVHQFYPIDHFIFVSLFLKFWKPNIAIFIDSEIWPNMFKNLEKNNIPIVLINGRITKKSFMRWMKFPSFAIKIFKKISLALPQNTETLKYLKILGVKKIKFVGNLKYFGQSKKFLDKSTKLKFKNRLIFCAASTHYNEELFIGKLHKELKSKYKNLLTIIIPRHIDRSNSIINELESVNLNTVTRSSRKKISKTTDIYIVDTYGEATKFYELSKVTFLGGSLIKHGGQNPLEPARLGNYILHGPNIQNFKEVYRRLSKLNVSKKVNNINNMKKIIDRKIEYKQNSKIIKKLNLIGINILKKNLTEINKFV